MIYSSATSVILFSMIYKAVLAFDLVDEILKVRLLIILKIHIFKPDFLDFPPSFEPR